MVGSAARVGAGGVVISGLSKTFLRARAWCDVAPANAVCCLASEGEHSSDDGSFLWPGGKYGIRRREGSGDAHKELVCADGREDGAAATFSDGRHRNCGRSESGIMRKAVVMPQELWLFNKASTGFDAALASRQV